MGAIACSLAAASLGAFTLAVGASPAAASVTLGQLSSDPESGLCGSITSDFDLAQPSVTSGNPYVVPGVGTITAWSHNSRSGVGQTLTMKIFRKVADPATYTVIGHDGPRVLQQNTLNGFPASIPVIPGDILGMNITSPVETSCQFSVPGESYRVRTGNMADGETEPFSPGFEFRLNLSAVFVYSNSFTLGATQLNKKKGTATIAVNVPNPGELTASGKGVRAAGAAAISKTITTPGATKLTIRAKGKQNRKLNETGKVKLKPKITYTPTGGDPSTQSLKVRLKKK